MHADNESVEAMLVERLTFWADYDHYIAVYPRRFKYTARIIRPNIGTYSIRDGMSFAVFDNFSTRGRYPNALDTGVDLYRYDYVHSVEQQARKFADAVHRSGTSVSADQDYFYTHYPRQFIARFEETLLLRTPSPPFCWPMRLSRKRSPMSLQASQEVPRITHNLPRALRDLSLRTSPTRNSIPFLGCMVVIHTGSAHGYEPPWSTSSQSWPMTCE